MAANKTLNVPPSKLAAIIQEKVVIGAILEEFAIISCCRVRVAVEFKKYLMTVYVIKLYVSKSESYIILFCKPN